MQIIRYCFQQHGDERGSLIALEENKNIPFPIKRVYFMYDTAMGCRRGLHAHRSLEQVLICIHGSCHVLLDDGNEKEAVRLSQPYEGIFVPHNYWHEMYDFSPGSVLMVLASDFYQEEDYIRDYSEFLAIFGKAGENHDSNKQ